MASPTPVRALFLWLMGCTLASLLCCNTASVTWAQTANTAESSATGGSSEDTEGQEAAEDEGAEADTAQVDAVEPEAVEVETTEPAPEEAEDVATNVVDAQLEVTTTTVADDLEVPGLTETTALPGELPSIAESQPGFIPDKDPTDLMAEPPSGFSSAELAELFGQPVAEESAFDTFLGPSLLPMEPSQDVISLHEVTPDEGLVPNYARLVVPPGGTIQGSTETKQFHIEGGATIYYSGVKITGQIADIDEKNEVAVLRGGVNIIDPKYELKTDELRIYFEDKRFQALGFVQFKKLADAAKAEPDLTLPKKDRLREYFAGQEFELFCSELYYDWDKLELTALDSVRLKHPAFNGSMDRLDYNDETKEYEMTGHPVLEVSKYDWIFANELIDEEDVGTVEALTEGSTTIDCSRVAYAENVGVAEFYALPNEEVSITQPTRSIHASYIEINDDTKDFYAEGDGGLVRYNQSEGEWLFAGGLVDRESTSEDLTSSLEGPMEVQAENFTYNFDRKRLALRGQVSIAAGEKLIKADEMVQDEEAKFFLMRGNVLLKPDEDSQVMAAQIFVDTETDVITLIGLIDGELRSDDLVIEQAEEELVTGEQEFEAAEGVFGIPTGERGAANVAENG